MINGPGTLAYRGYMAIAEVDMAAGVIYGEVINATDTITFQSQSLRDLDGAFRQAVDDYLLFCKERGTSAPKPFSGKCRLRLPPRSTPQGIHGSPALAHELQRVGGGRAGESCSHAQRR